MNEQQNSRLSILFIVGVDDEGANVTKAKTFSNIKGTTTDESLLQFTNAIVSLQQYPVADSIRNNQYSIM
ncbi:DUF1659 domain-containing protein [Halalkalibacter hemicellulosilyticus]|uniref:DUF1659 domain-containing protein n=1 Tax=Halalkalibacter hemicellulosilyticusJCM 9152 TaxID=1236971 RepID=W4QHE4_9BACI|nr:DUF1659 domain-containing protein [Halalkalibacter hemicellulosilyticus]GAE30764.1 hypothetical protein JCM9152_2180 [Halalkalibacter hemicellulosilyticusJCM 9152]